MISVLRNPTYAKLFSAQVIALLGTGLLTVALGLLAFDVAGGDAGIVMGVAMGIKMGAYVAVAPVTAALLARIPRRPVLIGADMLRAGVAVCLPFVSEAWQIYLLIFLLQSASATFTPAFQALIPAVLPNEREYTRALSLSRLAYDLESLISPMIAAALLTFISYHNLFVGTVLGFCCSAVLVMVSRFQPHVTAPPDRFFDRLTQGVRVYLASRDLRGLMGLNLAVATTTAMVVVNSVVLVQNDLSRSPSDLALLLGAYGGGSMLVALTIPRLLEQRPDRQVMLAGGIGLPTVLSAAAGVMAWTAGPAQWAALLVLWMLLGMLTSLVLTPLARILRRESTQHSRSAVFAAQFSLSHACFLITYPLAGILGAALGLPSVALVLVGLGAVGVLFTVVVWRTESVGYSGREHVTENHR